MFCKKIFHQILSGKGIRMSRLEGGALRLPRRTHKGLSLGWLLSINIGGEKIIADSIRAHSNGTATALALFKAKEFVADDIEKESLIGLHLERLQRGKRDKKFNPTPVFASKRPLTRDQLLGLFNPNAVFRRVR
jgi:hypothetical protein